MADPARRAKRALDIVASLVGLALFLPLLPLLFVAFRLESPGPLLCRNRRVGLQRRQAPGAGKGGRRLHDVQGDLFICRHFRVLADETRPGDRRRGEQQRLTRLGRVLRRTGLEDLPQLWNVLVGHMSLVGPRPSSPPFLMELHRASPSYVQRMTDVKPGLFGLARIGWPEESGFHATVLEKLAFDLHYASRLASVGALGVLRLDLSIVARCLLSGLARRRPVGNDVIRLDYPRRFVHLPIDALQLGRSAPQGLGSEVTESETSLTAWWYPPRRRGLHLPPPADTIVRDLCDEIRADDGDDLVFVRRLKRVATTGCDILRFQLPAGLDEAHHVGEHFVRVWKVLANRSTDEHFEQDTSFLLVAALTAVAGSVGGSPHRLAVSVEIDDRELRLRIAVLPDQTQARHIEPHAKRLASVLRPAAEVPLRT